MQKDSGVRFCLRVLMAGLCAWALASAALAQSPRYFTALASGESSHGGFRTRFQLANEGQSPAGGTLELHPIDFVNVDDLVRLTWVGEQGEAQIGDNTVIFTLPPASSLLVTLAPEAHTFIGWAKLLADPGVGGQAHFQVADFPAGDTTVGPGFEEGLSHEAELLPTDGLKRFAFPVWLFAGDRRIDTAFALVNLSAADSPVHLTLRPGIEETVTLKPGELFSRYFDRFFTFATPAIFPYELHGSVKVTSVAPLGITVFHTLDGQPLSGVAVVPESGGPECLPVSLDTPFTLAVSECATADDRGLTLDFWNVTEDSRCSPQAVCVWEGRVTISLQVTTAGRSEWVTLSTTPGQDSTSIGAYSLQLEDLLPAAKSAGTLEIGDYQAVLRIRRAEG